MQYPESVLKQQANVRKATGHAVSPQYRLHGLMVSWTGLSSLPLLSHVLEVQGVIHSFRNFGKQTLSYQKDLKTLAKTDFTFPVVISPYKFSTSL